VELDFGAGQVNVLIWEWGSGAGRSGNIRGKARVWTPALQPVRRPAVRGVIDFHGSRAWGGVPPGTMKMQPQILRRSPCDLLRMTTLVSSPPSFADPRRMKRSCFASWRRFATWRVGKVAGLVPWVRILFLPRARALVMGERSFSGQLGMGRGSIGKHGNSSGRARVWTPALQPVRRPAVQDFHSRVCVELSSKRADAPNGLFPWDLDLK
jgi:hypothetical protein